HDRGLRPGARALGPDAEAAQLDHDAPRAPLLVHEPREHHPDDIGLVLVDRELTVGVGSIAVGISTGDEEAPARLLAAAAVSTLPNFLPLVLGNDPAHVVEQATFDCVAAWTAGPFDRHAGRLDLLEEDELMRQMPGQPVGIVNEHDVDRAGADGLA